MKDQLKSRSWGGEFLTNYAIAATILYEYSVDSRDYVRDEVIDVFNSAKIPWAFKVRLLDEFDLRGGRITDLVLADKIYTEFLDRKISIEEFTLRAKSKPLIEYAIKKRMKKVELADAIQYLAFMQKKPSNFSAFSIQIMSVVELESSEAFEVFLSWAMRLRPEHAYYVFRMLIRNYNVVVNDRRSQIIASLLKY